MCEDKCKYCQTAIITVDHLVELRERLKKDDIDDNTKDAIKDIGVFMLSNDFKMVLNTWHSFFFEDEDMIKKINKEARRYAEIEIAYQDLCEGKITMEEFNEMTMFGKD